MGGTLRSFEDRGWRAVKRGLAASAVLVLVLAGCSAKKQELAGRSLEYTNPSEQSPGGGVGIESQDIVGMTDRMVRDMLANPTLAGQKYPPRVIIDAEYFYNESTSRINKNLVTDRLRSELNRAAEGRMVFIGRQYQGMVNEERNLKREGTASYGTTGKTSSVLGADYRLGGRITSQDKVNPKTGETSRYTFIIFELINLETSEIVWSNTYEFAKSGTDDVIYR